MKCTLVGSRYFGAAVLDALLKDGTEIVRVVAPAADDRIALAAQKAGIGVHVLSNPKIVPGDAIADGTDLIVAAHTHARVSNEALARSRLGGIGYHPSLLPRHRGIAAVEWTIMEGDPIAGGSVYHLADGWDAVGARWPSVSVTVRLTIGAFVAKRSSCPCEGSEPFSLAWRTTRFSRSRPIGASARSHRSRAVSPFATKHQSCIARRPRRSP